METSKTMPSEGSKRCSKCGEVKLLSEFYVRKNKSLMAECKVCTRLRSKARMNSEKRVEILKKDNESHRRKYKQIKDAVFAAYGGHKCACCGETEPLFLTLDHINNDGAEFRKKNFPGKNWRFSAGSRTYRWILKNNFPDGYQVLCANCNHGKRTNNGICPHEQRVTTSSQNVGPSGSKRIASFLKVVGKDEDMVSSGDESVSSLLKAGQV